MQSYVAKCYFLFRFYRFVQSDKVTVEFFKSDENADMYIRFILGYILHAISGGVVYVLAIDYLGRKKFAFFTINFNGAFCGFLSFLLYALPNENSLILISYSIAKYVLKGQFTLFCIYTAEQFPTYIRCICFGITNVLGQIGGFLAIYLSLYSDYFSHIDVLMIAGALSVLISPLIVFLEETHHKELDEMVENDNRKPLLDKN